ncbi:MAG: CsbD family protein [Hyphomonadaceae bacterium]|nr:CsbD family protein [Hyphomonadaceae bacterium]MBX3510107.1 CsbD family protein [Hyphomonadaceae bacterium]
MDKEHVKSAADKASGAIKEGVGKATGNTKLEAEGKIDKAKGEAREFIGDVKDAAKRADKH